MNQHLDWTYDKDGAYPDLPDIVKDLHDHSQKYVIIVVIAQPGTQFYSLAMFLWKAMEILYTVWESCKLQTTLHFKFVVKFLVRVIWYVFVNST